MTTICRLYPDRGLEERLDQALASALRGRSLRHADLVAGLALCSDLLARCARDRAGYQTLIAGREATIGLWLWRLALAVAAAGWPSHGLGLLDALPGVLVDGAARAVLAEACDEAYAEAGVASAPRRAVGGSR